MKQLTKLILILMSFILLTCNDKITGNNNGNTNNDNNNNNGNNINNWNNWNNNYNGNNDNSGDTGGNTPTPTVYKYADFIGTNYYKVGNTEYQFRIAIANIAKTNGRLRFDCDYQEGGLDKKVSCITYDVVFDISNVTTTQTTFDFYYGQSVTKPDKNNKLRTIDFKNKTITYDKWANGKPAFTPVTYSYYSKDEKK